DLQRRAAIVVTHRPAPSIYTLSLHDALPISPESEPAMVSAEAGEGEGVAAGSMAPLCRAARRAWRRAAPQRAASRGRSASRARADRKSTRLNSSHVKISYAVFCLKKKKQQNT